MSNRMLMNKATSLKQTKTGFSLLEVLVTITIVSIISAYAIPTYRRNLSQGHVDRYTQFLKTGLFSLRSRLAKTKQICRFNLNQDLATKEFGAPSKLVEFMQADGSRSDSQRLKCCSNKDPSTLDDSLTKDDFYLCTATDLQGKPPYRFLALEGTRESKEVEVAALQAEYELIPSGISAQQYNQLTILVKSRHSDNEPRLRTRCIELEGSAQIHSGTWNDDTGFCDTS